MTAQISIGTAGGDARVATAIFVGAGGANRTVIEAYVGAGGANRLIYTSADPLSATLTPSSDSWQLVYPPDYYRSGVFNCEVSGGTGPYSYSWNTNTGATASYPTEAATSFEGVGPWSGTISCTVVDANGVVAESNVATIS